MKRKARLKKGSYQGRPWSAGALACVTWRLQRSRGHLHPSPGKTGPLRGPRRLRSNHHNCDFVFALAANRAGNFLRPIPAVRLIAASNSFVKLRTSRSFHASDHKPLCLR